MLIAGNKKYRPRSNRKNDHSTGSCSTRDSSHSKSSRKEYTIGEVASIKIGSKKESTNSFTSSQVNESKPWRQPNGPNQSKGFTNKRLLINGLYIIAIYI